MSVTLIFKIAAVGIPGIGSLPGSEAQRQGGAGISYKSGGSSAGPFQVIPYVYELFCYDGEAVTL